MSAIHFRTKFKRIQSHILKPFITKVHNYKTFGITPVNGTGNPIRDISTVRVDNTIAVNGTLIEVKVVPQEPLISKATAIRISLDMFEIFCLLYF